MSLPQSNPDLYQHVRVVISIIVGLCITTLLSGFARFVQHPRREKVSILHLGWAASLLLSIIHFWWWEFRLALVPQWTFAIYFFVILYAILFYSLCTLLFPSDLKDYSGYEDSIRIVAGLALCLIAILTRNRRIQLALLAVSLLYQVSFIVRLYNTE